MNTSTESWESLSRPDEKLQYILEELREIKSMLYDEALLDRIKRKREQHHYEWSRSIRENATTDKEPA